MNWYLEDESIVRAISLDIYGPNNNGFSLDAVLANALDGDEDLLKLLRNPETNKVYGSFIHLLQWNIAFDDLKSFERSHRDNILYDYVGFTRVDMMWFSHPPLSVIEQARAEGCSRNQPFVLVLEGEDWQGVNDRYLFTDRQRGAELISSMWNNISHKDNLRMWYDFLISHFHDVGMMVDGWGPEFLTNAFLVAESFCTKRFTSTAALLASSTTKSALGAPGFKHKTEAVTAIAFNSILHAGHGAKWDYVPYGQEYLRGGRCLGLHLDCCSPLSLRMGGDSS